MRDRIVKGFMRQSQSKQYLSTTCGGNGDVELTDSDEELEAGKMHEEKHAELEELMVGVKAKIPTFEEEECRSERSDSFKTQLLDNVRASQSTLSPSISRKVSN